MIFTASEIYDLYRPTPCDLRVFLKRSGEPEVEPGPFDLLLRELGERHERQYLATLGAYADVSEGDFGERNANTKRLVTDNMPVIYQPVLMSPAPVAFGNHHMIGIPDLLVREEDGYIVRDCKLALHADEDRHPEILRQLELYGWLFEQTFGQEPRRLEVVLGSGTLVSLAYDGGTKAFSVRGQIRDIATQPSEPYSPVGWSKCNPCGFQSRCWGRARSSDDLAMVPGVDQALAISLRDAGVTSISALLDRHNEASLAEVEKPRGDKFVRVGKGAESIINHARAMKAGEVSRLGRPTLPDARNLVMFDVEALPPHLDDFDKVYLWGLQVFGEAPTEYMPAVANFGSSGDREGWVDFLDACNRIFERYGDVPFVHWSSYEKTKLRQYKDRHGDQIGVATRVEASLLDLLPVLRASVVLPDPSYSLKVVEQRVGFKRTMKEYGGEWSMAQYIKAVECEESASRDAIMSEILKYNEEDLAATWAVYQWLGRPK